MFGLCPAFLLKLAEMPQHLRSNRSISLTVDMKGFRAFPTESEVLSHNFERYNEVNPTVNHLQNLHLYGCQ